jgi:hypothetical protein
VRPPGHDRGVGQQQRGDEGLAFLGEFTEAAQHDDLGRAGVPADPDLRVEAVRRGGTGVGQHDDPAGVFAAGLVGRLDRFFLEPGFGDHHEGEHPAKGDHAALLAQGTGSSWKP